MAAPKATYAREQFDDPRLERLQSEVKNLRALVAACPFIKGSLVEDVSISSADTRITHRLGKEPSGVVVLKVSPAAAIGFSSTQPTDTQNAVNLVSGSLATVTATLWFW